MEDLERQRPSLTGKVIDMTRLLLIFVLFAGMMLAGSVSAQYAGSVSIDSIDAEPGDHIGVPIRLADNNEDIAAMMLPVRFDETVLTLDSVSFAGSLIPSNFSRQFDYDAYSDSWIVLAWPPIGATPLPSFDNASGVLCELHFTVNGSAAPGVYALDSANVDSVLNLGGLTMHRWRRMEFALPDGQTTVLPGFDAGQVHVRVTTDVGDTPTDGLPTSFGLAQNYPNPFNPSTVIEFELPRASRVDLTVYNVLGQEVSNLVSGYREAGVHQVTFDATRYPSGVYFYRLTHEQGSETKKMTLVK
jgi:hypothetical protein